MEVFSSMNVLHRIQHISQVTRDLEFVDRRDVISSTQYGSFFL